MKIKKLFSTTTFVALFFLSSCSIQKVDDTNLYQQNWHSSQYKKTSEPSKLISQMSLSIKLTYEIKKEDNVSYEDSNIIRFSNNIGTAWVYDVDEKNDNFYLATNLHVANVLSLQNKKIKILNEDKKEKIVEYGNVVSSIIGFNVIEKVQNSKDNSTFSNNDLNFIYTEIPVLVYATPLDENYNSEYEKFSKSVIEKINNGKKGYSKDLIDIKDGSVFDFKPMSEIAILKYKLPKKISYYENLINNRKNKNGNISDRLVTNESVENKINIFDDLNGNTIGAKNFLIWIDNYYKNIRKNISILDSPIDSISKKQRYNLNLYMGGFPDLDPSDNSSDLVWQSFSDFKIHKLATEKFEYSWKLDILKNHKKDNPPPIPFFVNKKSDLDDFNSYSFLNGGREIYFYAYSSEGASGSPILAYIENSLKIIGIYWGKVSISNSKNEIKDIGVGNVFVSNTGDLNINIIKAINNVISLDKNVNKEEK